MHYKSFYLFQNNKLKEFFISQMKLKKTSLGEVSHDDLETESAADSTEYAGDDGDTDVEVVPQQIIFTEQVSSEFNGWDKTEFVIWCIM